MYVIYVVIVVSVLPVSRRRLWVVKLSMFLYRAPFGFLRQCASSTIIYSSFTICHDLIPKESDEKGRREGVCMRNKAIIDPV